MRIKRANQSMTLGILGKIKAGEKVKGKNGYEIPKSLDYFRFTSDFDMRVNRMKEQFGEQPKMLPVTFHSDNLEDVCTQRFEIRNNAGQLAAYGDGEQFFVSTQDGFILKTKAEVSGLVKQLSTNKYTAKWDEILILRMIVLGYPEIGLWEFRTKGKDTSIPQIIGMFDTVQGFAGTVVKVPFTLSVSKHKSNRMNANRQYPVVSLICDLSMEMQEMIGLYGSEIKGLITAEKLQNYEVIEAPKAKQLNEG